MSDTGIRQFSCIRQVTDTGNILVTTAERADNQSIVLYIWAEINDFNGNESTKNQI